jgi:hypothetical protein
LVELVIELLYLTSKNVFWLRQVASNSTVLNKLT